MLVNMFLSRERSEVKLYQINAPTDLPKMKLRAIIVATKVEMYWCIKSNAAIWETFTDGRVFSLLSNFFLQLLRKAAREIVQLLFHHTIYYRLYSIL